VAWVKDDPFGVEFAEIAMGPGLRAEGVAIGVGPVPYRLDYTVETTLGFATSRLRVTCRGDGWRRTLDLHRGEGDGWRVEADEEGDVDLPPAGGDAKALAEALDVDLALCPVTNSMPILRHGLLARGDPVQLTAAWVSVPDLGVQADGQRYRFVRSDADRTIIRFEAVDGTFAADISLDADGIVLDYPGIARRLSGLRG
jgi:hypothetical protein